jgi:hypothetical protein
MVLKPNPDFGRAGVVVFQAHCRLCLKDLT